MRESYSEKRRENESSKVEKGDAAGCEIHGVRQPDSISNHCYSVSDDLLLLYRLWKVSSIMFPLVHRTGRHHTFCERPSSDVASFSGGV